MQNKPLLLHLLGEASISANVLISMGNWCFCGCGGTDLGNYLTKALNEELTRPSELLLFPDLIPLQKLNQSLSLHFDYKVNEF